MIGVGQGALQSRVTRCSGRSGVFLLLGWNGIRRTVSSILGDLLRRVDRGAVKDLKVETTFDSGVAACHGVSQLYHGLAEADELYRYLRENWDDSNGLCGSGLLASMLRVGGLAAQTQASPYYCLQAVIIQAFNRRRLVLIQVGTDTDLRCRRWALVTRLNAGSVQWAEFTDSAVQPRLPDRLEGYYRGQLVVVEDSVPERAVIKYREGSLVAVYQAD